MKNIAPLTHRILSGMIDCLFYLTFYQLVFLPVVSAESIDAIFNSLLFFILVAIFIFPFVVTFIPLLLISNFGGTLGKLVTGLEIVDDKGERISFHKSFFRNYVGYIASGAVFWLGFVWIARDSNRRGWHDMIAGTYVTVKKKSGKIIGVVVLLFLFILDFILTVSILQKIILHENIYKNIVGDVVDVVKNEMRNVNNDGKINKYQSQEKLPSLEN
jgi:uncharacterized RDD family membrane protein YckC